MGSCAVYIGQNSDYAFHRVIKASGQHEGKIRFCLCSCTTRPLSKKALRAMGRDIVLRRTKEHARNDGASPANADVPDKKTKYARGV